MKANAMHDEPQPDPMPCPIQTIYQLHWSGSEVQSVVQREQGLLQLFLSAALVTQETGEQGFLNGVVVSLKQAGDIEGDSFVDLVGTLREGHLQFATERWRSLTIPVVLATPHTLELEWINGSTLRVKSHEIAIQVLPAALFRESLAC